MLKINIETPKTPIVQLLHVSSFTRESDICARIIQPNNMAEDMLGNFSLTNTDDLYVPASDPESDGGEIDVEDIIGRLEDNTFERRTVTSPRMDFESPPAVSRQVSFHASFCQSILLKLIKWSKPKGFL